MSKASKRATKKARNTIVKALKCELHNTNGLAEQYAEQRDAARAEVKKVTAQADESGKRSLARMEENVALRASIDRLKETVAGLEVQLGEANGRLGLYEQQADQAAPKVMVMPPRMLSPDEARQFYRPEIRAGGRDLEAFRVATGEPRRKHWSAE